MSLRAERSNLFFSPALDCFVALLLAMTAETLWQGEETSCLPNNEAAVEKYEASS